MRAWTWIGPLVFVFAAEASAATETAPSQLAFFPPLDCAVCPFSHPAEIERVEPLLAGANSRYGVTRLAGARIVLRAEPGVTGEYLRRALAFHLACPKASTDATTECPLDCGAVAVDVSSMGGAFAVDLSSGNRSVAVEILRRANALVSESPPSPAR